MATISEDYVSFECAKLLKEKGFDGWCVKYYNSCGGYLLTCSMILNCGITVNNSKLWDILKPHDSYAAPTLQMACKWLRIEHNIHIEPHIVRTKCSYGYMPNYIDLKELKQHFPFDEFDFSNADEYVCITYDKACEVALKYCLENLI